MKHQIQNNKIEWKEVELGEFTNIDWGNTSITKSSYIGNGYPAFSASGMDGFLEDYEFEGEGIILSAIGARCGKCFIAKGKWNAIKNTIIIRPQNEINIWFLFFQINKESFWKRRGAGQPFLTLESARLQKVKFPFLPDGKPDLKEQERIVSILEKAEELNKRGKKAEELLDEYLKSVFYEMFYNKGFEKSLIRTGIVKTENKNPKKDFPERLFKYIDIASIDSFSKKIVETKEIMGKDAPSRAKQLIKFKDILVSTVRPNLNSVALVPNELSNQICSTGFCVLRADDKNFLSEYLFFIVKSDYFVNELVKKCKGANYPAVSSNDILDLKIPLPPLSLQQKFASVVEKVEKMKENVKKTKQNSEELFNSLMSKAFRGEL